MAGAIDNCIGCHSSQFRCGANRFNHLITDQERPVMNFSPGVIHRRQGMNVVDEQGGHWISFKAVERV